MLDKNIARELARICLPLSTYTEWYWKIDLNNLFKFLRLRLDTHAQYEIRVYAQAIAELIKPIVPLAFEAFEEYWLKSKRFSYTEAKIIKEALRNSNFKLNDTYDNLSNSELKELKKFLEE